MEDHNRTLLVLFDSRQKDAYSDVESGLITALDHWGMPYRRHDLSGGQPGVEMLRACAAVVVAQQHLCTRLADSTAQAIAEAVADGVGYVGCDGSVGRVPIALQHVLGVRVDDVRPVLGARAVDTDHGSANGRWTVSDIGSSAH